MKRTLNLQLLFLATAIHSAVAIEAPVGLVSRSGDQSIVLQWDRNTETNLSGYRIYRSITNGPFFVLTNLPAPGYCDLDSKVVNGKTNVYRVTALTTSAQESLPSATVMAVPHPFADDDEFLEYVQQTSFDYFWYGANQRPGPRSERRQLGLQHRGGGVWVDRDQHWY